MVGLIKGLYQYQTTMQAASLITDIGVSLILSLGLWMTGQLLSVQRLKVITENAICDYLENYLKSKLDGEYEEVGRQIETPDHYARALKETAASRPGGGIRSKSVRRMESERFNSEVDAKIVEDVLMSSCAEKWVKFLINSA